MTAIYGNPDTGAEHIRSRGWWPIPIHDRLDDGTYVPTGKTRPEVGATGNDGVVTDEKIERWVKVRADHNVGLRHQGTIAIDVDHDYGGKVGGDNLAAFAKANRLPPLPATCSSTARGSETMSRQHFYRIPEGLRLNANPVVDVEVCQFHHRFSVAFPSIHPSLREPYRWYGPGKPGVPPTPGVLASTPSPHLLPWLPQEWAKAFAVRHGSRADIADGDLLSPDELLDTFPEGPAAFMVLNAMTKASNPDIHMGHDATYKALFHAFRLGIEGHGGVPQLVRLITTRHRLYLDEVRPQVAETELNSARNGLLVSTAHAAQRHVSTTTQGGAA